MKIIAESASNHQGNFQYLLDLATASKQAGADYFTAQILHTDSFCDPSYTKRDLIEKIVFTQEQWVELFNYCKEISLEFIPCAADLESFYFCHKQGFKLFKLHGSDLLNMPLVNAMNELNVELLVETQLATVRDINLCLSKLKNENIKCLFHGYSNYPTEGEELNLNAIKFLKEQYPFPVGFADHSTDTTTIPMMAMAMGTEWLEKHITLSRNDRQPDWQPSLTPEEFRVLMAQRDKYQKTMGPVFKHPTSNEVEMRKTMYKKYIDVQGSTLAVRANSGPDYYEQLYKDYDPNNIVTAVVARLKSTRLKKKVLLPFHNDTMVFDLIKYADRAKSIKKTILATSYVAEDDDLAIEAQNRDIPVYRGHPLIVIDRLIDLAESEKAGGVFRITGDMPFADPELIDKMSKMALENNLDYVRVMNFPLGMSAEYFKTSYLQKLYIEMDDPNESEYLGWFVILDREARKGCLEVEFNGVNLGNYSLTVDYQEDLDRCHKLLKEIGKDSIDDIRLEDILEHLDTLDSVSDDMVIKLPKKTTMNYKEFVQMQWDQGFIVKEKHIIKT